MSRSVVAVALTLGGLAAAAPAALARSHSPRTAVHAPKRKIGKGTSTNWSGYAVDGTNATHVVGSWTEPSVTCAPGETGFASPWVGIDGDNSNTVEQTGTDADCQNGVPTYFAWWEMYPKPFKTISMTVKPGDSMTGSVHFNGSAFVLTLTDNTTGATFTTTQSSSKAKRSSVEWIMEGPSNGSLSDYGTATFTGASATINGTTGSLGAFAGATPITMVTNSGTPRSVPSGVSGGTSFTTTWKHS